MLALSPQRRDTNPPTVVPGGGEITVTCNGVSGENVNILISLHSDGTQVVNQNETLNNTTQSFMFQLPAETYDVTVTQPSPGPVFNFPSQVVT